MTATLPASTTSDLESSTTSRIGWIDGARGLSIVVMIASHVGLTTGVTPQWFHLYLVRPIAPTFLLLLGYLWRPGFRRRHVQFIAGALAAAVLAFALGYGFPNILTVMGLCLLVAPVAMRWPALTLAACVTQLAFWPMPDWWTGYPPGFALALVVAGRHLTDGYLEAFGRLGSRLGLEPVGRRPLTWYLGHLLALVLTVGIVQAVQA